MHRLVDRPDGSWFFATGAAFLLYWLLMRPVSTVTAATRPVSPLS